MAKTNPIGVRFRPDILESLEKNFKIDSPQQALVFLERFYVQHSHLAKDITQVLRDGEVPYSDKKIPPSGEKKDLSGNDKKRELSADVKLQIEECKRELAALTGTSSVAIGRKKFLRNKIDSLYAGK